MKIYYYTFVLFDPLVYLLLLWYNRLTLFSLDREYFFFAKKILRFDLSWTKQEDGNVCKNQCRYDKCASVGNKMSTVLYDQCQLLPPKKLPNILYRLNNLTCNLDWKYKFISWKLDRPRNFILGWIYIERYVVWRPLWGPMYM